MKLSELPEMYRRLALKRGAEQAKNREGEDDISRRFSWYLTPENHEFWERCNMAKSVKDLPPIPEASIFEVIDKVDNLKIKHKV